MFGVPQVRRARTAIVALAWVAALCTACSTTVSGHPLQGPRTRTSPGTGSASTGPGDFPSSARPTTAVSGSVVPSSAVPSSAVPFSGCSFQADYCDDFSDRGSGWPVTDPAHFFARYDPYLGGSYRIGERHAATLSEDAPTSVSSISNDYSVRVDVDTVVGPDMPRSASLGVACWEHQTKDGSSTSSFLFFLDRTSVTIGLWADSDGAYHQLARRPLSVPLAATGDHLTVGCIQGTTRGGVTARLSISINGIPAASLAYAKSARHYPWAVGDGVGVLASGNGADVFYDNFAITSECSGTFC